MTIDYHGATPASNHVNPLIGLSNSRSIFSSIKYTSLQAWASSCISQPMINESRTRRAVLGLDFFCTVCLSFANLGRLTALKLIYDLRLANLFYSSMVPRDLLGNEYRQKQSWRTAQLHIFHSNMNSKMHFMFVLGGTTDV